MNFVFSAPVRRYLGTSVSTRNVLVSSLIAAIAIGVSSEALARKPQAQLNGATADAKPRAVAETPAADAHVLIQLTAPAAVEAYAKALSSSGGTTSSVTPSAIAAGRNQMAANKAQQAALVSAMNAAGIKYKEIYRVQRAMNGVAVIVPTSQLTTIRKLAGVKAVRTIVPSVPTSNTGVTFVGANNVWQGIPAAQADGTGIRIGIIDSGIDYQHANFGGTGLLTDYQANDRVTINPGLFPTPKVIGGYDFAGDAYNGSTVPIPTPDPNPTDCGGHGSHVAGIAAGFGVTTAGGTFAGPYDTPTILAQRIPPGMAPKASLYALRVFGCGGSTDLVVDAIDWALDPNGDGDLSDHLDIINMSLGSATAGPNNPDVEASENAALSGMIVVASAGNSGDTYYVIGSPSVAPRTISVAASADNGELTYALTISTPPAVAGSYPVVPAAFGPTIPPAGLTGNLAYGTPTNGCGVLTPIAGVAGKIAVIDRGVCTFQTKVYNAQLGGATGAIVVQNSAAAPIIMGGDATVPTPAISSAMIARTAGQAIEAQLLLPVTVTGTLAPGPSLADTMASFSSRGPTDDAGLSAKPDITAPGVNVVSTQSGMTCTSAAQGCITPTASGFDPDSPLLVLSGTSMAAPNVAGLMALLRQLHPTLSVEEMKALAMNGALHDLSTQPLGAGDIYGSGRVGAGRDDAVASANLSSAAFNADGSGTVGVAFPGEISAATNVTRKVRVKNYASTPVTFTLGIDTIVDNSGVSFSLPGGTSLTLLGNQTRDIDVLMTASANALLHEYDLTIAPPGFFPTQVSNIGTQPRYWQSEETAYLTFNTGGPAMMRVPLYVAPNPTSSMTGGASVPTGGGASGATAIPLTGTGVCTGALTPGPSCAGAFPFDEESLVTPFELQVSNPRNLALPAQSNLKHAGVSAGGGIVSFGLALWGPAAVPVAEFTTAVEVTILVGGTPKYILFPYAANDGTASANPVSIYLTGVYNIAANTTSLFFFANGFDSSVVDTRIFHNDVFYMTAPLGALGLSATDTIHYRIDTYSDQGTQETLGPFALNMGAPGLDFGGNVLFEDLPGASIPVNYNVANLNANGSLGALLLHHHNAPGSTSEVLTVPPVTLFPAVLQSAVSRKVHGGAGTFDLPLPLLPLNNPATEPRQGPTATVVMTFDKPINGATVTITEGTATAAAPTFSGNDVFVSLTGVTDIQYVTVSLTNVAGVDGSTGGTGTVRLGFLLGDVNGTRTVTLSDLGQVNAQLSQPVSASNYKMDVNANGSITLGDKGLTAISLTHALTAP